MGEEEDGKGSRIYSDRRLDTIQYTNVVLKSYVPEIYILLLINVTQ